jgi:hypothetical protein
MGTAVSAPSLGDVVEQRGDRTERGANPQAAATNQGGSPRMQ